MTKRTCKEETCARPVQARNLCTTHYSRWYKQGKEAAGYRPKYRITCTVCTQPHMSTRKDGKYCSLQCRDTARRAAPRKPPKPKHLQLTLPLHNAVDRRGPLRRALEDGGDIMPEVRARSTITPTGCWEWRHMVDSEGYPRYRYRGDGRQVEVYMHRAVLEAKHGRPLGTQAAHHKCANRTCVNPDHLQPVSHRDNVAEMLARNYLKTRIRELEEALRVLDPKHPLLNEIGLLEAS